MSVLTGATKKVTFISQTGKQISIVEGRIKRPGMSEAEPKTER